MKAVLLLHGFLSNKYDFKNLIPILEKYYDHIEAITFPGHSVDESYDNFTLGNTLELLFSTYEQLHLKYNRIDVVGYSMGGAIASYLASIKRVGKLILLAPANKYFNVKMPFDKIKTYISVFQDLRIADKTYDQELKKETREFFDNLKSDDSISVSIAFERFFRKYIYKAYRTFRQVIKHCNENLGEITAPTYIAWGKLDQLVPEKSIHFVREKCINENTIVKIYPFLTHLLLNSKDNGELLEDLEQFIKEE
jgi:esterase/lipase